ncbi:pancreatic triacylglycerol lipase isoform X1 [Plutella xylostella]|uniref:pancreatic triacylglycerol lipase isoform X1 n=1 Tax=Plutella xylostella TaxID=51655 RepID=UPI0020327ED6|nr:pancreatic triacylglycerol lipase isoform X1 [Plutella xylostella]
MAGLTSILVVAALAVCAALPTPDPVLLRPSEQRFQYAQGADGQLRLVDLWLKTSDVAASARYDPDRQNVYHLFTRQNPTVSQPLLLGSESLLELTHFSPDRRTVVLLHGWLDDVLATFNSVLVPSFLQAADVNVIVVDWSAGANVVNYAAAVRNTVKSGESVAWFITWLNSVTGADSRSYHVVGHSLGAHQAGVIGRHVEGGIAYITALDPALPGWLTNSQRLRPEDAQYTEVIHTNAGLLGYAMPLGHTDFYPNGGVNMPGCGSQQCDHERSIHYFGESLTSSTFVGRRCASYLNAMTDNCLLPGRLAMGGLVAKTGSSGIYLLKTNAEPPFAQV